MKCINCGGEVKSEYKLCPYCGSNINATSDHYEFGNEYICEDCKFVYLESHLVYGEE